MAGTGFAGGLAEGLRNGIDMVDNYERTQTLKDERARAQRDQDALDMIRAAQADGAKQWAQNQQGQGAGAPDLSSVTPAQSVDLNQTMGLSPVQSDPAGATPAPVSAPAALEPIPASGPSGTDTAPAAAATGAGLGGTPALGGAATPVSGAPAAPRAPAAAATPSGGLDTVTADYKLPATQPNQAGLNPSSPTSTDQSQNVEQSLAALSAGIRKAWEVQRPDQALHLMVQREKLANASRAQAYTNALSKFQVTNDPNAFLPFVNTYLNAGVHVDSITPVGQTSGGTPMYTINGTDLTNGKKFSQPASAPKIQSFITSIADPETQKALFVQQANHAYKAQQAILNNQLAIDKENAKPITVGKDQTAYKLGPDGTYKPIAFGSDVSAAGAGMTKSQMKDLVAQNKNLAGYVFKLNGVSDLSSVGTDQRKAIANTIALGENINRLNQGAVQLGDANTAQLANDLTAGKASLYPVRLKGGSVGYATNFNGQQVLVPNAAVPMVIRQRYERQPASKPAAAGDDDDEEHQRAQYFQRNEAWAKPAPPGGYLTKLSPADEQKFQAWVKANHVPFDPSPDADYDMRGFWKSLQDHDGHASQAVDPNDGKMHYTDYFKTPYHETFSRESKWAKSNAPEWNDRDQLVTPDGKIIFDDRAANKRKQ